MIETRFACPWPLLPLISSYTSKRPHDVITHKNMSSMNRDKLFTIILIKLQKPRMYNISKSRPSLIYTLLSANKVNLILQVSFCISFYIALIIEERQRELAFEGDRLWDLRRKNIVQQNVTEAAGLSPEELAFYPIPQREIDLNPNIN